MRQITDVIFGKAAFAICIVWLCVLALGQFWPTSYWMEVRSVNVSNAREHEPIVMLVDRVIHRPFIATWNVTVREIRNGEYLHVCNETAQSDYVPGANLPDVLTLGWWSNGRCLALPHGDYIVTTAWHIHGSGVLPDKSITATSNIFQIR